MIRVNASSGHPARLYLCYNIMSCTDDLRLCEQHEMHSANKLWNYTSRRHTFSCSLVERIDVCASVDDSKTTPRASSANVSLSVAVSSWYVVSPTLRLSGGVIELRRPIDKSA